MRKTIVLWVSVLMLICLCSCALAGTAQGFGFTLQANLTTGYDWVITFDDDTLAHIEGSFVLPEESADLDGAPGYYDYVLLGDKEGEGFVTLAYMFGDDESTTVTKQIYSFYVDADLNVYVSACGTMF